MTYDIEGTTHRFVDVGEVVLSVYEAGEARPGSPLVVFSHGFPELAFSWRHQLRAVAAAGFHAIAPDQRGYGGSSRPEAISDYDIFHLAGDLVGLVDAFGAEQAVIVGHDWGGLVAWQMPLLHPDRTAGVAGLCTPYYQRLPSPPTEVFRIVGGENHYILYFQEPGVADAALGEHTGLVFERMMRRGVDPEQLRAAAAGAGDFIQAVVNAPVLGEELLAPGELAVFVEAFTETGFTGGLNWYRNFDRNWELTPELEGARIDGLPCLMLTAEWDPVLAPALAANMASVIDDLEVHMVARAGHWVQQECPDTVDGHLVGWLQRRFG